LYGRKAGLRISKGGRDATAPQKRAAVPVIAQRPIPARIAGAIRKKRCLLNALPYGAPKVPMPAPLAAAGMQITSACRRTTPNYLKLRDGNTRAAPSHRGRRKRKSRFRYTVLPLCRREIRRLKGGLRAFVQTNAECYPREPIAACNGLFKLIPACPDPLPVFGSDRLLNCPS
jgi:hypothetical protein